MPTPPTTPDPQVQEQVLTQFRNWMLALSPDRLAMLGIDNSIEEPLRLLRGFATDRGFSLG